jgi:hypothetical protein
MWARFKLWWRREWLTVAMNVTMVALGAWLVWAFVPPRVATPTEDAPATASADVVSGDGTAVAGTETFDVPGPGTVNVPGAGKVTFVPAPSAPATVTVTPAPATATAPAPASKTPAEASVPVAPADTSSTAELADDLGTVAGIVNSHEPRIRDLDERVTALEAAKTAPAVSAKAPAVSAGSLTEREVALRRSFNGPMRNVTEAKYIGLILDGLDPQPTETDSDAFREWLAQMSAKHARSKQKKAKP